MEEIDLSTVSPELKKILLIGAEGAGKTHFIGTMPRPLYLFSFDKGYETLSGEFCITVGLCLDKDRYNPVAYRDFKTKFDALKRGLKYKYPDGKEEPYKTIAIDSVSFLSTLLFDNEQKINNNIDKPGGYSVYGVVKSKLQDVITQAIVMAEHVVCTALLEVTKDDLTGEIFYVPSIVGSIKNEIGAWFDAVFYITVDKSSSTGEPIYKLVTVGDRRYKAKMRIPSSLGRVLPPTLENPSYQGIISRINEAKAKKGKS